MLASQPCAWQRSMEHSAHDTTAGQESHSSHSGAAATAPAAAGTAAAVAAGTGTIAALSDERAVTAAEAPAGGECEGGGCSLMESRVLRLCLGGGPAAAAAAV